MVVMMIGSDDDSMPWLTEGRRDAWMACLIAAQYIAGYIYIYIYMTYMLHGFIY